MKEGKLNRNDQKTLKVLSKVIEVVSKICEVVMYIGIVGIVISMFFIPTLIKHLDVKDNKMVFDLGKELRLEENKGSIIIYSNDKKIGEEKKDVSLEQYKKILKNNNKDTLIMALEFELVLTIIYMFVIAVMFRTLNKLFKNIEKTTPFTLENIECLKKLFRYLIISYALSLVITIVMEAFTKVEARGGSINIMQILFTAVIIYIFKYGYELQKNSKGNIYDEAE